MAVQMLGEGALGWWHVPYYYKSASNSIKPISLRTNCLLTPCSPNYFLIRIWYPVYMTLGRTCWKFEELKERASLVAQWLRICLPMQGTRVRALVWEDPTCRGATRPVSHNYWGCASGACAPQQERPRQWEARAPRWRVAPACRN